MSEERKSFFKEIKLPFSWARVWLILAVLVLLAGIFGFGLVATGYYYQDRVFPNIRLGQISIGSMDASELKTFLEKMDDKMMEDAIQFEFVNDSKKENFTIFPSISNGDDIIELIDFDVSKETERLLKWEKEPSIFLIGWQAFTNLIVRKEHLVIENVYVNIEEFKKILEEKLATNQKEVENSNLRVMTHEPFAYTITTSSAGYIFDYDKAVRQLAYNWSQLKNEKIMVEVKYQMPQITEEVVRGMVDRVEKILSSGDLQLFYLDARNNVTQNWDITKEQLSQWLEVQQYDSQYVYGLQKEKVEEYLTDKIKSKIDLSAKDAKFKTDEEGKVIEFQGSRSGVSMNIEKTYNAINTAFIARSLHAEGWPKSVSVVSEVSQPKVSTGAVNNLGISEVLGVGYSSFAGSPTNRIKNIRAAVNKLNGVLIKPGEEFSAIKFLAPFTLEGGYLPELVIKGDEIKPEIGGGLCQIGTTLFRMAMNSAMKITSRRNHSLVVNYYNDPANKNPGTDATIYEPAPDFKFLNDTNSYVLLQTELDSTNQKLYFTLWGTNDGRQGSYMPPTVIRWIPVGARKIIETTKLAVGKKECQHAYTGADTTFTYTRVVNGDKEEIVYESHYRPLPEICLVGVEEKPVCTEGIDCGGVATSTVGVLSDG